MVIIVHLTLILFSSDFLHKSYDFLIKSSVFFALLSESVLTLVSKLRSIMIISIPKVAKSTSTIKFLILFPSIPTKAATYPHSRYKKMLEYRREILTNLGNDLIVSA